MRHEAEHERAAGDEKGVGGAQQKPAGRLRPRITGDGLDGAAVRAHHHARAVHQAGHRHITSRAPWLMLTSASPRSIWLPPRCSKIPSDPNVIVLLFWSVTVIVLPSSSNRIFCPALVTIALTLTVASSGCSPSCQKPPTHIG